MIALNLIILYNIIKVYKFQEAFFIGMMLGTFFNGLLAFGVIHVNFPIFFPGGVRFMGTTINPNIIGGMVLFSLMGSILYLQYAKNRFWIGMHLLNILLGYYLILMTVSRTSLVITSGILAIFTLQLLLKKGTRTYLLLFILLATMIMISFVDLDALMVKVSFALKRIGYIIQALSGHGTEHSADERLAFIQIALGVFYENPIFGTGINTMRVFLGGLYSHNNYVELLATTGLVGATLYYSLYFTLVKNLWNLTDIWIKIYISLFIFAILLFDLAGVTYYSKPVLTMLLVFSYLVEEKGKSFQQNDDV
jgi:O-antigen ligase